MGWDNSIQVPAGSTSLHGLNADRGLPLPAKFLYFLLNRLNNLFPMSRLDPKMEIRPFTASAERLGAAVPQTVITPARVLTHLFWQSLPWPEIQQELGGIRILDVGCGSADYAVPLQGWSGGRIERYLGVDAEPHPEWDAPPHSQGSFAFARCNASEISRHLAPETSLILSSSTLEHLDQDLGFFEQVRDHVARCGRPLLQIHIAPSSACLRLFLLHGIRQYTPRTLSKVTRLFTDQAYATLFLLGGAACARYHFRHITCPILMGQRASHAPDALRLAIVRDEVSSPRRPYFYALAIHSNWRVRLFQG